MNDLAHDARAAARESNDDEIAKTRSYFDATYPGPRAEELSPMQRLVFEQVTSLIPSGRPDQVAVDLGCHWGRYTRYLATTYGRVWGIDLAAAAVQSAPSEPNVRFHVMDLEDASDPFPFRGRVDLFVAVGLLELLRDPAGLCHRLGSVAGSGSRVFILIPNRRSIHYRAFRVVVWIARHFLGRRSLFIHNNGARVEDVLGWMSGAGFRPVGHGGIVGLPPAIVDRFPGPIQQLVLPLDSAVLRIFGGSYHWVLLEKETTVAGSIDC